MEESPIYKKFSNWQKFECSDPRTSDIIYLMHSFTSKNIIFTL